MASSAFASEFFEIEHSPKSCLELLAVLRRIEAFVAKKIEWVSSCPPVFDEKRRISFPLVKFNGPTQTPDKAAIRAHQVRTGMFKILAQELPQLFAALGVEIPGASAFRLPEIISAGKRSVTPAEYSKMNEASKKANVFWVEQSERLQKQIFANKELPSVWVPSSVGETPGDNAQANHKVYPEYPIRSLDDLEKWIGHWIKRCALPERPATPTQTNETNQNSRLVTITVPRRQPPFQPPDERVWRCSLEDLTRELRNCTRACHAWRLPVAVHWEGDPHDHVIAEDRLMAFSKELDKFRKSASESISNAAIGSMHIPQLVLLLSATPKGAHNQSQVGERITIERTRNKKGRPKKSESNIVNDSKIYKVWSTRKGQPGAKAELAREYDLTEKQVVQAIDRHRKYLKNNSEENTRK